MGRIGRHLVAMCWVVVALFIGELAYGYVSEYPASGASKIVVDVVAIVVLFWLGSVFNGYRITQRARQAGSLRR
jgi:hypothetical protein